MSLRDAQSADARRAFGRGFRQRSPLVLARGRPRHGRRHLRRAGAALRRRPDRVDEGRLLRIAHDDYVHVVRARAGAAQGPAGDAHHLPLRRLRHHGVLRQRGVAGRRRQPRRRPARPGRQPGRAPGEHGHVPGAHRQPAARAGHPRARPRADPRDRRARARRRAAQRPHAAACAARGWRQLAPQYFGNEAPDHRGDPRHLRLRRARTCASARPASTPLGQPHHLRDALLPAGAPRATCRSASGATCSTCSRRTSSCTASTRTTTSRCSRRSSSWRDERGFDVVLYDQPLNAFGGRARLERASCRPTASARRALAAASTTCPTCTSSAA